eukprot:961505-Pelagomonas_calceolata.AAC.2
MVPCLTVGAGIKPADHYSCCTRSGGGSAGAMHTNEQLFHVTSQARPEVNRSKQGDDWAHTEDPNRYLSEGRAHLGRKNTKVCSMHEFIAKGAPSGIQPRHRARNNAGCMEWLDGAYIIMKGTALNDTHTQFCTASFASRQSSKATCSI